MKALIAHLYLRGLYGVNQHDIELLFSAGVGPNVFGVTMYQQRMKFILPHITFDDKEQRQEHWSTERFAAATDIFEMFNKNYSEYFFSSI